MLVAGGRSPSPSARPPAQATRPKHGGILKYVVPAEPPSFDGHRETTFALIHPIAPFYSLLIRVNPNEPYKSGDFVCDLCTEMPKADRRRQDLYFPYPQGRQVRRRHATLTAKDVVATYNKIIFPPAGVPSARKAFYVMVDSVTAPDDHTVVFKLKYPSGAFIPALANPYNFIYPKAKLDKDMHWYEKNVDGLRAVHSGTAARPAPSSRASATRTTSIKGKPYLDGFEAIFAKKQSLRVQAIRGDRAAIEFRGFPPQGARRPGAGARQQDHRPGEQLELRADRHAEPQAEAVRRRARAARADAGDRPLGRLASICRRSPS